MKALKIILAIAVVAIIGFFVTYWETFIDIPKDSDCPKNQFTKRIESDIDSLKKMPENKFCQKYYDDVQYRINEFYKDGSFGLISYRDGNIWKEKKDDSLNNQWNEILCKNLYSAYAPKFVEQAMYVFSHSAWKYKDRKFIRSEVKILNNSTYLSTGEVSTSFYTINTILKKYAEINNFIYACKGFTCSNNDLESTFPDLSDKIQKSRAYITNNLDNTYVNNCSRLKEGLQAIPKILFDKHISYLTKKINNNGARYGEFNYQYDYSNSIYTPLRNQVDALDNDIYGVGDYVFSNGYYNVYNLLSDYNREATNYYKYKRN